VLSSLSSDEDDEESFESSDSVRPEALVLTMVEVVLTIVSSSSLFL
jgi:hypothetical protein